MVCRTGSLQFGLMQFAFSNVKLFIVNQLHDAFVEVQKIYVPILTTL